MHIRKHWATLVGVLALAPALVPATTLYMSPSGSDKNTGTSATKALKSLLGVLDQVKADKPKDAVKIVVAEGTYLSQTVAWNYFNGKPITFSPPAGAKTKPVFDGEGTGLTWFTMYDSTDAAKPTNLHFIGLKVTNYWLGLDLGRNKEPGNSQNEVRSMLFERVGAFYTKGLPQPKGYAALRMQRSSNNIIADNRFHGVKNSANAGGMDLTSYIHAIYAAHNSTDNVISDNEFNQVTGDAVRTRDGSNNNLIEGNLFVTAGKYSAYSDWIAETGDECPSYGNLFKDNTVGDGYFGAFKDGYITHTYGPDDRCGTIPARITENGTIVQ
ncbi:pectin lyase fold/virulence factor [Xylaria bambusicola]|uniref:pectin lyase fold/virulence factor n=1 Tax=Xylaria bambusicola TaxID=326684 RepID=UPI00200778A1|nr:pectin lyase fold/virulence factor [Xylaria bambusicola]KAI0515472.1 pectin lyase fold/virulence factor [Xylaria bambusicola]